MTITLGGGQSFTLGGGGSGSAYWNVSGATPGGNTAGGSGIGGKSSYIAGDRSSGVNPDAGIGSPPPDNSAYITGGNGQANTGSGGGSSSSAEVVFAVGNWGVLGGSGGSGGSGVVIIGYSGTTAYPFGGVVTISGGYVTHRFTSSTTFTY